MPGRTANAPGSRLRFTQHAFGQTLNLGVFAEDIGSSSNVGPVSRAPGVADRSIGNTPHDLQAGERCHQALDRT